MTTTPLSRQQMFDTVWDFFAVKKNTIARKGSLYCSYTPIPERGNTCGCAIGCLLTPEEQTKLETYCEGTSIGSAPSIFEAMNSGHLPTIAEKFSVDDAHFLCQLQQKHDGSTRLEDFVEGLREVAKMFELTVPAT